MASPNDLMFGWGRQVHKCGEGVSQNLGHIGSQGDDGIVAAKAETVRNSHLNVQIQSAILGKGGFDGELLIGIRGVERRVHLLIPDRLDQCNALEASCSSKAVPCHGFCTVDHEVIRVIVEGLFHGPDLCDVTSGSRCGMGVHVAHLLLVHTPINECLLDASAHPEAILTRLGHVMRVARSSTAKIFAEDGCAPSLSMREAFENEDASALAKHESVTCLVPRPGSTLRVGVVPGESPASDEACKAQCVYWGFNAATQHEIRQSGPDVVCCRNHAVVRGRTRRGDRVIHSHEAGLDSQHTAPHVRDSVRDEEGAHLPGASLRQGSRAGANDLDATHARPDEDAALRFVQCLEGIGAQRYTGVLQRPLPRDQAVLQEGVQASRLLQRDVVANIEVRDLSCELRGPTLCVEAFYFLYARHSLTKLVIEVFVVLAKDRHYAHACDHDTVLIGCPLRAHPCLASHPGGAPL
mmetsp:Transcript_117404/g.240134  ORF Transcript_117404/g.240134 Transcript_117404/m.240134 type:complete len:466 (-) Transcript_117404:151-1548(-)